MVGQVGALGKRKRTAKSKHKAELVSEGKEGNELTAALKLWEAGWDEKHEEEFKQAQTNDAKARVKVAGLKRFAAVDGDDEGDRGSGGARGSGDSKIRRKADTVPTRTYGPGDDDSQDADGFKGKDDDFKPGGFKPKKYLAKPPKTKTSVVRSDLRPVPVVVRAALHEPRFRIGSFCWCTYIGAHEIQNIMWDGLAYSYQFTGCDSWFFEEDMRRLRAYPVDSSVCWIKNCKNDYI